MRKIKLTILLLLMVQFIIAQKTVQYTGNSVITPKNVVGKQNSLISNVNGNPNNSVSYKNDEKDLEFISNYWKQISEFSILSKGDRQIIPLKYKTVELNIDQLKIDLGAAVHRKVGKNSVGIEIELPNPDGGTSRYLVFKNTTMSPGLEANFPSIRAYDVVNIDKPSEYGKIDITPQGFHGMIFSLEKGTFFIDPYQKGDLKNYLVYYRKDFNTTKKMECEVESEANKIIEENNINQANQKVLGSCDLRTYRLVVAATGEYTTFHGGTVVLAQAAQVTTMNRVNGIFERDAQITMTFVANNSNVIYTNAATDPYTNGTPGTMINENQTNCNAVIGSANYDIGHVFGTNSGGLAQLFSPCSGNKARGVTGSAAPVNDPFDIDYVAHEMGHQWGANHTQNNNCNRNNATAVEPGSASSIMGYAGICAPNVQSNSDDHFHGISVSEMSAFISGGGSSCDVLTPVVNVNPVITGTNGNVTIPASTPFALTAIATDPNAANVLSYCWEQMDNQVSTQSPVSTSTGGPNFRSISPTTNPTRYFPTLASLMAGGPFTWEVLSSVSRTMNFRVTVRDNAGPLPEVGCIDQTDVTVTVDASTGPFVVTYPSATGITWTGATSETVTWNVAGTTGGGVNCANVDILLSTDGGVTFPTVLASGVPNDGSQPVTVPNTPTTTAVIMVICSNGTFFDISDNVFTIIASTFDYTLSSTPTSISVCPPNDAVYTIDVGSIGGYSDVVTLSTSGVPAGATATFATNPVTPGNNTTLTISNTGSVIPGSYPITVSGNSTSGTKSIIITLIVSDPAPTAVTLTTPANLATGVLMPVNFAWTAAAGAGVVYDIDIATDIAFTVIVDNAVGLVTNSYVSSVLSPSTTYYWRVRAYNGCGTAPFSSTFEFTTGIAAGCDTLNFPPPGTLTVYAGAGIGGYVAGWNTVYQDVSKAEYFSAASHAPFTYVTGGLFYVWSAADGGNGATVDFNVWDGTGAGGSPGTILGTVTVPLSALNTVPGGNENTIFEIIYPSAVNVGAADFYFGLSMNGFGVGDSLGIVSNTDPDSSPATAWEEWSGGGGWFAFDDPSSWGLGISQFMSPYVTDVPPTATITSSAIAVCEGDTINFDGTSSVNAGAYNWTFSGGSPANSTNSVETVTFSTAGNFTEYLVVDGACQSFAIDSLSIVVNTSEDPTFNYSSSSYCQSDADPTPTISGTGGGIFTSSPAGLSITAGTGVIDVSTSTPGTYGVLYTTPGPTCQDTLTVFVTINATEDATFNYSAASYCQSDADQTPTISGTAGGTFTSSPAGLSLTAGTGVIDVSSSTPGTYGVLYTTPGPTCQDTLTVFVTINATEDATFNYLASSYCQSDADPTPTISGTAGGTFTSSPVGLSLTAGTGVIDVSTSTPGTYGVLYTTPGVCADTLTVFITITTGDDATFNYSNGTYCVSGTDPTPTISGTAGGTFTSSPVGLSINSTTGMIDLSLSVPNFYTVTYTTSGTCPDTLSIPLNVVLAPDATFSYTGTPYCGGSGTATVTYGVGASAGFFSATPAGLTINSSNGDVDLLLSTPGTYAVKNYIAASGGCAADSVTSPITIIAPDTAAFSYSASNYCPTDTDPTPIITGTGGGTFSSTFGLVVNATTGIIDVSASIPNTYTVVYATSGACPDTSNVVVTINATDDASFGYSFPAYCQNASDPTPTILGTPGGTFSSTAGLSINASTGTIDLSLSIPNAYTVTYTTSGSCPDTNSISVTINSADDATFNYSALAYCQDETDPTPTISGTAGGTFTSSPAGLSINGISGVIDLSLSLPNTYSVTYTTLGFCSDNSSVNVTINPVDDATFNYSAASYCQSDADPTPTISGTAGGTFTSSPGGLSLTAGTGVIDVSTSLANTYTVTYTTGGICPDTSSVNVTIDVSEDATFSYSAASYCQSDADPTPTISGTAGGTFTSSPAGLSLTAGTGVIDVSASTPGTYGVMYTTPGPICQDTLTVFVTINATENATFNYSATSYCTTDADPTPIISGTGGGIFTSSPAGLSLTVGTGLIDLSTSTPGTYGVLYTTPGVCTDTLTVFITVTTCTTAPTSAFSSSDSVLCIGDCIDFTDLSTGNPTGWTWYFFGSATATSNNQNPSNICYNSAGTFDVALVTTNATGQDSLFIAGFITVNSNPVVVANASNTLVCEGNAVTLTGSGASSYIWDNGAIDGVAITPTNTTTFTVIGSDVNGCTGTDNILVTVNSLPTIIASNDTSICASEIATITATGGLTYSWDNAIGIGQTHTVSPSVTTTYIVTGDDINGCTSTDQVVVTIDNSTCFNIPNVFSPNGDGKNDTWIMRGIEEYPNVSVKIFNRWGGEMYNSIGYTQPWDGTYNGTESPSATYYYIIDLGDGQNPINGTVNIIR
jgi:gliding motility-associated-like protein